MFTKFPRAVFVVMMIAVGFTVTGVFAKLKANRSERMSEKLNSIVDELSAKKFAHAEDPCTNGTSTSGTVSTAGATAATGGATTTSTQAGCVTVGGGNTTSGEINPEGSDAFAVGCGTGGTGGTSDPCASTASTATISTASCS